MRFIKKNKCEFDSNEERQIIEGRWRIGKFFFVQLKCFETNDRRASVTCARFMRSSEKHLKSIVLESRLRSSYATPSVSTPIALRSFMLLLDSTDPWLQLSILVNWKIALGICTPVAWRMRGHPIEKKRKEGPCSNDARRMFMMPVN